jgi:hypothetical protein
VLLGLLLSGLGHGVIYTVTFIIGSREAPAAHQGTADALLTHSGNGTKGARTGKASG